MAYKYDEQSQQHIWTLVKSHSWAVANPHWDWITLIAQEGDSTLHLHVWGVEIYLNPEEVQELMESLQAAHQMTSSIGN